MSDTFVKHNGLYRCAVFDGFDWQTHAFGTREISPVADITLRQIHSARVLNADGLADREAEGDGLVTDAAGVMIGIRTADCVPILLLDAKTRSVAAVHAGWRGTAAGIIEETVRRMRSDFLTDSSDVYAAIGPCIRACCYRVGIDVAERFREWNATRPGNHVDLVAANRIQMEAAGVLSERVFDSDLCTFCNSSEFYSFRREPDNPGRMVSGICRQI